MSNIKNFCKKISIHVNKSKDLQKAIPIVHKYNSNDWKKFIKTSTKKYTKNKIFSDRDIEVYIISWLPGQKSPIHNHSKNGCILKILSGNLTESVYTDSSPLIKTSVLNKNNIGFMRDDLGLHSISNEGNNIAISLHIYSPPNHKTKFSYLNERISTINEQ